MYAEQIKARKIVNTILGKGVTYADPRAGGKIRYKWMLCVLELKDTKNKINLINQTLAKAFPNKSYKVKHLTTIKPIGYAMLAGPKNEIVLTV